MRLLQLCPYCRKCDISIYNIFFIAAEADDPYSVDSDEEKELLKDIKDEIKTMVKFA